jgi:hypothetical protein
MREVSSGMKRVNEFILRAIPNFKVLESILCSSRQVQ